MEPLSGERPLSAQSLADILNKMGVRPEIMSLPTVVSLKSDSDEIVWLPKLGWMAVAKSAASKRV
jgi:hypothetical protein